MRLGGIWIGGDRLFIGEILYERGVYGGRLVAETTEHRIVRLRKEGRKEGERFGWRRMEGVSEKVSRFIVREKRGGYRQKKAYAKKKKAIAHLFPSLHRQACSYTPELVCQTSIRLYLPTLPLAPLPPLTHPPSHLSLAIPIHSRFLPSQYFFNVSCAVATFNPTRASNS